ncbi:hypothetical protein ON010_g10204 [Phytophthora cinnamomi]|nr:hypothetical protein ON010_g10204 [Phytophthora cinnamomi]
MNSAAAQGWLHKNQGEGCTTLAMDGAASGGRLGVVKWMHANRSEGYTTRVMHGAAVGGYLDVVKWLHGNRAEGCTTAAMDNAASQGHLEVVKSCMTATPGNAKPMRWITQTLRQAGRRSLASPPPLRGLHNPRHG